MTQGKNKILFINFSAEINQNTAETFMNFITQKLMEGFQSFYILLSSPGGNVINGITVYNFLRSIPANVITHNIGIVDSIANVVFLAGKERYATPISSFLFHGVGFDVTQTMRLGEKNIKELLLGIQRDQYLIIQIIQENTKLTQKEIEKMFEEAITLSPQEAKELGFINDIRNVEIPSGTEVVSLAFLQRPWR